MITSLDDLHILALDCQTTGANPANGHLLEIGWVNACASTMKKSEELQPETYVVKLPPEAEIPRSVKRITGIGAQDLEAASAPQKIWRRLARAAQDVAATNHSNRCLTIIHFSRFEEPFLRDLYHRYHAPDPFPFQLICTHEIARRLLPGLPRRGLRAIAGYFGHSMPEFRRSADHALATAFIWKNLIVLLKQDAKIATPAQLVEWMKSSKPRACLRRSYPMDPEIRRNLPAQPGVYRMLRANGDVLYIGKAKSLKQRVSSYFRQTGSPGEHILEMLTQAYKLDYTLTGSALEAAIVETDEIKQHSPPYNVALRKRQRRLVFCTKDLTHHSHAPDEDHPVGPLPSGNLIDAIAAFSNVLSRQMSPADKHFEETAFTLLGIPMDYAPEIEGLAEGLDIFKRRHQQVLHQKHPLRSLTRLGALLWREHLEQRERDDAGKDEIDEMDEQQAEDERRVWYPEDVAHIIEGVIMRAAYLIRRSRWLCLLSESTLAWTSPSAANDHKIVLYFKKGAVVQRQELTADQQTPMPADHVKPFHGRRQDIDLFTYDRLRVVTTELRRLISEDRRSELRLGPKAILHNPELAKALRWV